MASPSLKRGKTESVSLAKISFLPRRLAAWGLEVYLVALSGFIPYSIGSYLDNHSQSQRVEIHPILASGDQIISHTLALPPSSEPRQVPPLTNLFWGLGIVTPIAFSAWQLHLLAKTGRTLPKYWLNLRVLSHCGHSPGWLRILLREGLGKWGLPWGTAYLIWRYSLAFPNVGLFLGLGGAVLLLEASLLFRNSRRRCFHDYVGGTKVVDARQFCKRPNYSYDSAVVYYPSVTVETPAYYLPPAQYNGTYQSYQPSSSLKAIRVKPSSRSNVWHWLRHSGVLLLSVGGIIVIFGSLMGTHIYLQTGVNQRQSEYENNLAFLNLVNQLSETSQDPLQQRKSAILALARLEDPRSIPLLVDLLNTEKNPALIETIQQAIISVGLETLPDLKRLNQALSHQLATFNQNISPEQQLTLLRLKTSQQAIAQLLLLHHNQLQEIDLSRVNLGQLSGNKFTLKLDNLDLAGINFREAIFNNASFRGASFSKRQDRNYWLRNNNLRADLSKANLNHTDFTKANLSHTILKQANLKQANLNQADLSHAQLENANLSSARLLGTNLTKAHLENAHLTGANLAQSQWHQVNLQGANLGQIQGMGASFTEANLSQSYWQNANLTGANLSHSNLKEADLSYSLLKGVNFQNAQLQRVNFTNADLSQADLRGANLEGANLQGVILATSKSRRRDQFLVELPDHKTAAKIKGVDFSKVENLSQDNIEFICNQGGYHPQCNFNL